MKNFLSVLLMTLVFSNICLGSSETYTVQDKYGRKVSTYKTTGNTTVERNRYGQKIATYKHHSNGTIIKYDKYGRKIGTIKED